MLRLKAQNASLQEEVDRLQASREAWDEEATEASHAEEVPLSPGTHPRGRRSRPSPGWKEEATTESTLLSSSEVGSTGAAWSP